MWSGIKRFRHLQLFTPLWNEWQSRSGESKSILPTSDNNPQMRLKVAVRCWTKPCRTRCTINCPCCCTVFDRHKAHLRSGNGLADGLCIGGIVLAAFAIRRDELGCHQAHGMPMLREHPRPMMCAGAGLHADQARGQLRDQFHQIAPCYLGTHENRLAGGIDAMQREDILCQINSERYDDPVDFPFRCGDERLHFSSWHLVADNRQCAALPGRGSPFHSLGIINSFCCT